MGKIGIKRYYGVGPQEVIDNPGKELKIRAIFTI
jgi:hypothetical protein